ncbi:putative esterase C31F10.02 [Metarhizium anisopliae]|nr:putative esterase C31F10.02 [Metarhizium anisopliae]
MAKKLSPTAFTKAFGSPQSPTTKRTDKLTRTPQNRLSTLHGGTLASLVDLGGSLAVASTGRFATGVSTDLNVTYLAPGGKPGDLLRGTATCDKSKSTLRILCCEADADVVGKTLAFTTVTFTNGKGQLAARGSHTKFVLFLDGGKVNKERLVANRV